MLNPYTWVGRWRNGGGSLQVHFQKQNDQRGYAHKLTSCQEQQHDCNMFRCTGMTVVPHKVKRRKKRLMMICGDHVHVAACHKDEVEVHLLVIHAYS